MNWHSILETTFLVMFWLGLVLTVVMGLTSGAFHHEVAAGSSFESGLAHDLGGPHIETVAPHAGHAEVGWSHGDLPGFSPWSPTVICAALTGAGGIGWLALTQWNFEPFASAALGLVGGLALGGVTFGTLWWAFRRVQASSHVTAHSLLGTKARVDTAIEPGQAGAVVFVAQGARMVVPARSVDAAAIPTGAEVEIVQVDAGVYQVKETRESWLARSKTGAR